MHAEATKPGCEKAAPCSSFCWQGRTPNQCVRGPRHTIWVETATLGDLLRAARERDEAIGLLRASMAWHHIDDAEDHREQWHAFRIKVAKLLGEDPPMSREEQDAFIDQMMAADARVDGKEGK